MVRIALALVMVALLAGCRRFERASECRSLARLVNPTLKDIDEQRHAKPADAVAYETIAARYSLLSGAIAKQHLENKRLQEPVMEYQRLLLDASRDARQFAEALNSKDETKINAARALASRTAKRETALVGKIDAACRQK